MRLLTARKSDGLDKSDKKRGKKSPVLSRPSFETLLFMDDPFHEKMSFAAAMLKVQHMPLLSLFK